MATSLLAAVVAAVLYGVGSVLQAVGAGRASGLSVVRHPAYVAGLGCDGVAWLLSLVALRHLPLFAVQAVLAGSLVVTVLLAVPVLGTATRRRDWVAVGWLVLALGVVGGAAGTQPAVAAPEWFGPVAAATSALLVVVLMLAYRRGGSVVLALLAGTSFGGAAVCARAVHGAAEWQQVLGEPLAWCVAVLGVAGALGYARALERGAVGPATAVLWAVEVVLPAVVGVAVLGDGARPGWGWVAFVAVVVAVVASAALSVGEGLDSARAAAAPTPTWPQRTTDKKDPG